MHPRQQQRQQQQHIVSMHSDDNNLDEQQQFLLHNQLAARNQQDEKVDDMMNDHQTRSEHLKRKAKLARQETMEEFERSLQKKKKRQQNRHTYSSCLTMILNTLKRKAIFIPLIIISCIAAIYCVPFIDIEPKTVKQWPSIPFDFQAGPLRASTASQFKVEKLFRGQVQGPESIAIDSMGNMYMAIEGGFVLYAHLNSSSTPKRDYYAHQQTSPSSISSNRLVYSTEEVTNYLVKIAELNGVKQIPTDQRGRRSRESDSSGGNWRRECSLDEKIYGSKLYSGGLNNAYSPPPTINQNEVDHRDEMKKFKPNVMISRCSKPLGIRLSPDENYLYVIDTLSGLYRVSLRTSERPYSTQRLVTKLVDFRNHKSQLLPIVQYSSSEQSVIPATTNGESQLEVPKGYLNISLLAVDDLVIDYGAGTRGGDMIYMSDASQTWPALSYIYDMLEGRPSGVILRYDSGANQLSVLNPVRLSQVRTSTLGDNFLGFGAPRFDENDVFDDRPLHFPNGLELTDDRQAILIADTTNKRIIKHWLRGPQKGSSDLWAWTPMFPDNIRRGYDKGRETYWVVGCGQDMSNKIDALSALNSWPRLRKYLLKNIYLFGWLMETVGTYIMRSNNVRDFGYSFKIGHFLCNQMCAGMIIIQYNKDGDIIRSIHSKEFPNDLVYYAQVNELIDAKTQEHILYLSSPYYDYVTKLTLPTDVHPPELFIGTEKLRFN